MGVQLNPGSIQKLVTVEAQAYGKPEGTMVRLTCYAAGLVGTPEPNSEVAELQYFSLSDAHRTTDSGRLLLSELRALDLID